MRASITFEEVKVRTEENFPKAFKFLDDNPVVKNVHEKLNVRCLLCGDTYSKRINDLLHNHGCRACNSTGVVTKVFRTTDSLKQEVDDITYGEYLLLGEFVSTRDKTDFYHIECESTFNMKVHSFVTLGQRCPFCVKSARGKVLSNPVKDIIKYLKENGFKYELEKTFKGLFSEDTKSLLPYDVFLPDIKLLIEYDGQQHFHPVPILGGSEWHVQCVINDGIKNQWAKKNGYELIRIPYTKRGKIKSLLQGRLGTFNDYRKAKKA